MNDVFDACFVKTPNYPDSAVTSVAVGQEYASFLAPSLEARGISVLELAAHGALSAPVRSHADMLAHHIGGNRWIAAKKYNVFACKDKPLDSIEGLEIIECDMTLGEVYPSDIALNALRIGNKLFCCVKYTSKILLGAMEEMGVEVIDVKQGYARCSSAPVTLNAVMTADRGMAAAFERNGIETLLITPGYIHLTGFGDGGFIGGCCGKLGPHELAFTGRLDAHPDHSRMIDFLERFNVKAVSLTDKPVFDCGGLLPATETRCMPESSIT